MLRQQVTVMTLWRLARSRTVDTLEGLRRDERGMTTETVIIIAALAALAITVMAIVVSKVTNKANSINVG